MMEGASFMISGPSLLDSLRQYRLLDEDQIDRFLRELPPPHEARALADELVQRSLLTSYQAGRLLEGAAADLTLGQHVIIDRLGEGGMGQVLKARHRRLKRIDAIKIIRPDCLTNKLAVKRFFLEAEVVARLDHPNIIRVYDAAEDGDRHYFVMEYVPGVDLGHLVAENGVLPLGLACEYIRQAALGLQHAHEKHLVHRDIKPSNLLLARSGGDWAGTVKVLDLGLAQLRTPTVEGEDEARPLTPHGMIMGTPDFMAPEQAENSSRVDIRADIYSLGCSFYQLLTGNVPYPGGSLVEKLTRHNYAPFPKLPADVPAELAAIVEKMMAKRPDERFQQPAEVAVALAPFSEYADVPPTVLGRRSSGPGSSQTPCVPQTLQEPPSGAPVSLTTPLRANPNAATVNTAIDGPRRKKKTPLIAAVVVILLVAAGAATLVLWPRSQEPEPVSRVEKQPEPEPAHEPTKERKKVEPTPPPPPKVKPKEPVVRPKEPVVKPKEVVKPPKLPGETKTATAKPIETDNRPAPTPPGPGTAKDGGWKRVDVLVEHFESKCDRAAFSADGRHALAGNSKLLTHYTLAGSLKSRTIDPFLVSPSGLVSGGNTLGAIVLTPDGSAALWATITTTDEPVNGMVSLTAEYDTVVRDDSRNVTRFYGDVWSPTPGKSKPPTRCMACSPDGKVLATGGKFLRRWNLALRPRVHDRRSAISNQCEDEALCLACSLDSKYAVVGCMNRELYLYPLDRDSETPLCEFKEHAASPRCVAFVGHDGIVSGDNSGQVCVWKMPASPAREAIKPESAGVAHTQAVLCVAGSKDDLYATGGADGLVRVGRVSSKEVVLSETFPDEVRALVFAEDDRQLLVLTSRQLAVIRLTPPTPQGVGKGT
jgi:serine/threonine protein kinase